VSSETRRATRFLGVLGVPGVLGVLGRTVCERQMVSTGTWERAVVSGESLGLETRQSWLTSAVRCHHALSSDYSRVKKSEWSPDYHVSQERGSLLADPRHAARIRGHGHGHRIRAEEWSAWRTAWLVPGP
jgi:hypothetical protein